MMARTISPPFLSYVFQLVLCQFVLIFDFCFKAQILVLYISWLIYNWVLLTTVDPILTDDHNCSTLSPSMLSHPITAIKLFPSHYFLINDCCINVSLSSCISLHVSLSMCIFVSLSAYVSLHVSFFICLYSYVSLHVPLFMCLPSCVFLHVYLSMFLSLCLPPSVSLHVSLFICLAKTIPFTLFFHQWLLYSCVSLYVYLSMYLFMSLSAYASFYVSLFICLSPCVSLHETLFMCLS